MKTISCLLLFSFIISVTAKNQASAQTPLPITNNNYTLDAVTLPIIGSSRSLGMGGAYTAQAEGIDGVMWNIASVASRTLSELEWFTWDLSLSFFSPGLTAHDDYHNSNTKLNVDSFYIVPMGLRLQFGRFGIGLSMLGQNFLTTDNSSPLPSATTQVTQTTQTSLLDVRFGIGYAFWDSQLITGIGTRGITLNMQPLNQPADVSFNSAALELGTIIRPDKFPWRMGIAFRYPVASKENLDDYDAAQNIIRSAHDFILPSSVYVPWELRLGFSWQLGPRPANQRWFPKEDPRKKLERDLANNRCERMQRQIIHEYQQQHKKLPSPLICPDLQEKPHNEQWWQQEKKLRVMEDQAFEAAIDESENFQEQKREETYKNLARRYVLITTEVLFIGPTKNGISMDGFIQQVLRYSGRIMSISPRLGVETEIIPNQWKLRGGCYIEPARSSFKGTRVHGTFGFDYRLFSWNLFGWLDPFSVKASYTIDIAKRYIDMGFGIGIWH